MTEFKFVPGEYRTRDGRRAIVRFRVQEPCNSKYPLVGEIEDEGGHWDRSAWMECGAFSARAKFSSTTKSDLLPPVRYCYKNCYVNDTGGKYEYGPLEYDAISSGQERAGVLRFELTPQNRPDWRTVEFIPVENLEHA